VICGRWSVFRTFNVIDEANRGALGIDVAVSIPATRLTVFLGQMIDLHGRPSAIRCDNAIVARLATNHDYGDAMFRQRPDDIRLGVGQ
jgi:hypothetical protein